MLNDEKVLIFTWYWFREIYAFVKKVYCLIGQSRKKMVLMNIWIIFQPSQVPFYFEEVELQVLLEINEEKKGKTLMCFIICIFLEFFCCIYPDDKVMFKWSSKNTSSNVLILNHFRKMSYFQPPLKTSENLWFLVGTEMGILLWYRLGWIFHLNKNQPVETNDRTVLFFCILLTFNNTSALFNFLYY